MRKLSTKEIPNACRMLAESFAEYGAYRAILDEKHFDNGIYWLFRYELHVSSDYNYTDGDTDVVVALKRPGDKDKSDATFFANPFRAAGFLSAVGRRGISVAREYVAMTEETAAKFYNPDTDCYLKNIGVKKSARGKGLLRKALSELCGDMPIYLETHTEENVAIYRRLGFEVCAEVPFYGFTHYAMKREGVSVGGNAFDR